MGEKYQSNSLSLPLPKWASFENDLNDPSRDFPAGPYHRMVAKLYGLNNQHMANPSSIRFYPVGVQPSLSIDEPRQEAVARSSYSEGKLTHDVETRLGNASVRFYSVGPLSKYSIGEAVQEGADTRLHSDGQHIQSLEGMRKESYAGFYPAGVLPSGGEEKEDATTRLHSGGNFISSVEETKVGAGSVRFYPVGVEYANGARQEAASTGLLSGGQLAHSVDERSEKDASSSRYKLAGLHNAEGTREIRDSARLHLAGSEPKHLIDEPKPGTVLERISQVDGQPIDPVRQEKRGKAPAKVAVREEKLDRDSAKVAAHEEKLDKVPTSVVSTAGNSKANMDNAPSGVIFMCNKKTRTICFHYSLFGLPAAHSKLVKRIVPQTKLFLFVLDTRELHGVFEATSNGALDLEPRAFGGSFPSQVRFRIRRECKPLAERDFKKAIEANYFQRNKFSPELSAKQVTDLLQMFCPGESLEKKVEIHETHLSDPTKAHGIKDHATSEPAECQSELSMEISPQNSPAVDSFKRSLCPPSVESQRGAQPRVMEASREISRVQGVRGQASMEDLIVGGQGVQSLPMERLRSYYSPSVERSIFNKSHYMDVKEDFQSPLTEDPMLVQSVGFQKNTESYLREASGQGPHSMVDQKFSETDIQRAIFHPQDSVQQHISNSGLQSWRSGLQGQKLSHVDVERGNLSSWVTMMRNTHQLEQDRHLSEMDHSKLAEGKVYINESGGGRQQGREDLERALEMFEKELNQNMNPHGEELDRSVPRFTARDREQEEVEGKSIAHSFPGRPADASSFQMYKRMFEDPAGSTSNSYPWKRQACYAEPFEDKMAEARFLLFDKAAASAGLRVNALHAGNNVDESNSRQLFSNAVSLHDPQELGRNFSSQSSQASGRLSLPTPMVRSTFPIEHY